MHRSFTSLRMTRGLGFVEFHPFAKSAKEWGARRLGGAGLKNKSKGGGQEFPLHTQEEMHRSFTSLRMTRELGFVESHPFAKSAKEWGTRRLKPQALKRGMI